MTLKRYLTGLIWLCIAPLLLLGSWLAVDQVLGVLAHSRADAQAAVRRIAASIDEDLRDQMNGLKLLADSPLADDPQHQSEFYREAQVYQRHYGGHVIKTDARARAMSFNTRLPFGSALPPLPRPAGRAAVDVAADSGKPEVSDAFVGQTSGVPMVALAVPVQRDGATAFFLVSTVEVSWLEQHLVRAELPAGSAVTLRDSTGKAIARHGGADADGGEASPRFGAALTVVPWTVDLEVARATYIKPTLGVAAAVSAGLALMTLAGVLGGSAAARRLTRAMRKLVPSSGADGTVTPRSAIEEIATAQDLLLDASRRREQAETERRRDEQRHRQSMQEAALQLEFSETRLRGIFDGASDGIVTVDAAQNIVMVNRAAARMFGYEPAALIGKPLDLLLPERARARHRLDVQAFAEADAAARPMGRERPPVRGLRADGETFALEAAISYVHVDGQRLFTAIVRDITERQRNEALIRTARAELEASHAELRRLVAAQDQVQEQERKRIARELHDDLQQTLAAIKMDALAIGQQLQREPARTAQAAPMLAKIDELATAAIASTRRIVNDLRPQMLEDLGLRPALEALAADFRQRTGIAVECDAGDSAPDDTETDGHDDALAPTVATCLYRVAQESLNNVSKHAGARQVRITLTHPMDGRVCLRIADDGNGFAHNGARKRRSFGLVGMEERVHAIGGDLHVDAAPGRGTVIEVNVSTAGEPPVTTY